MTEPCAVGAGAEWGTVENGVGAGRASGLSRSLILAMDGVIEMRLRISI